VSPETFWCEDSAGGWSLVLSVAAEGRFASTVGLENACGGSAGAG